MKSIARKFNKVALDTNIFNYHLDQNSPFYELAEELFSEIAKRDSTIFTSVITLTELLAFKAPQPALSKLEQEFLLTPNLVIVDVNVEVAKEAAKIRRQYGFRLPDSVQLATAITSKTQVFISNDRRLKNFKECRVILLSEI